MAIRRQSILTRCGGILMAEHRRVYWDACAWLGLLNGEGDKLQALQHVWAKAQTGEIEIWTSAFCLAEVYRLKCEGKWTALEPENDAKIDNLFDQDFVKIVQMDSEVARLAKQLLRTHEKLRKPSDAIHLATAVLWDIDQFHTYDDGDLLGLIVTTANGSAMNICKPSMIDGENLFNREGAVQ
jgi:predicted nucleic acid-binding protein